MILTLSLSRVEFAAKRRGAQDRLVKQLSGVVGGFLSTGETSLLKAALTKALRNEFKAESDRKITAAQINAFLKRVETALTKAKKDSSVQTTTLALALAVLNEAAILAASAEDGSIVMEWVTMHDNSVRNAHQKADGEQRPVGEKFKVGGVEMRAPGDMTAPIELWINCRCVLRPAKANEEAPMSSSVRTESTQTARDVSKDERDKRADDGTALPDGSFPIANCEDLKNAIQAIGRAKDPAKAKAHIKKRKNALDCPDVELPEEWAAEALVAAADVSDDTMCIMAVPAEGESAHGIGSEEKHATLIYFGEMPRTDESDDGAIDSIKAHTAKVASEATPFTASVSGIGPLGHDDTPAQVWLLDSPELHDVHAALMDEPRVKQAYEDADTTKYPEYTPHVTIDYAEEVPDGADSVSQIAFDRLAVWHGSERTEYPLGEPMTAAATAPPEEAPEKDAPPLDDSDIQTPPDAEAPAEPVDDRIPWHGVLAPENVRSGDGRSFTNLGRTRDLPLPLTWQETSAEGHDQNITVAQIEKVAMIDGLMHASGHFLSSVDEADEAIGLIAEFGRFGVSVDADDIGAASFDEASDTEVYDDPRICSACIVSIPAFAEAYVAIGPHPILDTDQANGDAPDAADAPAEEIDPEAEKVPSAALIAALHPIEGEGSLEISEELFNDAIERGIAVPTGELRDDGAVLYDLKPEKQAAASLPLLKMAGVPESFKQAVIDKHNAEQAAIQQEQLDDQADAEAWAAIEQFVDVAPGITEDGPGWLTHPVDTDRLRDYWVRGPGAAKIGWGAPGDFNRCRVNVAQYVKPQYLNGYCANRHYDALHVWPGQELGGEGIAAQIKDRLAAGIDVPDGLITAQAPALTLVASGATGPGWFAPSRFFDEPVDCDPDDGVVIEVDADSGLMRTYGYIAEWGVCHIGYDGMCKEAPPSASNYAYFRTGQVNTPDGPVKTGRLTAGTGHANPRLSAMPAAAHYDNTGSAWAFVACGENERGIWFSGLVKPGTPEELLNDVVASGRISGDWRPFASDLELVAGLTVNVPGFPIVPTTTSATDGRQLSLVAAGVPAPKVEEAATIQMDMEPSTMSIIASLVVDEMEARNARRARFDAIKEKVAN